VSIQFIQTIRYFWSGTTLRGPPPAGIKGTPVATDGAGADQTDLNGSRPFPRVLKGGSGARRVNEPGAKSRGAARDTNSTGAAWLPALRVL